MATTEQDCGSDYKRTSLFRGSIAEAASSFRTILKDTRPALRPFAALLWGTFLLVINIAALPLLLYRAVSSPRGDPVDLLRVEVETVWRSAGAQEGIAIARRVHAGLRERVNRGRMWRTSVPPYGRLGFYEYASIAWYLCHWEMQIGAWSNALAICDDFLVGPLEEVDENWAVTKARALAGERGDPAAIAYLASVVASTQRNLPRVEEQLARLRKGGKPS